MTALHDNATEPQRQLLQDRLDASRSAAERNRLGQFATPNTLALAIARYAASLTQEDTPIRFGDPSIGSGSFFSAALSIFGRKRLAAAVGIEIDPEFCQAARDLWSSAGLEIVQGDFTRIVAGKSRPPSPNFILANPPYVRHHHITPAEKERLQAIAFKMTAVAVNGLAGLYVYFLLLATAWMEDDGCAAWLIPSEFMDVNYGMALKRFLTENVMLLRVHRFDPDDVQFGDALVSSVILFFRKVPPRPGHAVQFTFGGTLQEPLASSLVPVSELVTSRKWTMYPKHSHNDRHRSITGDGPKLGDFFCVRRGIATGSNKFFILDRSEAQRRRLPAQYLRPILPSPRNLKTTVIDGDKDGYPLVIPQLCLIDCDLPELVLQRRHPELWEYLHTADVLGVKNGYLVGKRVPWYKQERREPAPFLCTYMGRGSSDKRPFRFIWNHSAAIGTNLYLMLYPRNGLADLLRRHADRAGRIFEMLSQITGQELRGEGRVYGGGLHKIEPSELGRISAEPFVKEWPELTYCLPVAEMPLFFS